MRHRSWGLVADYVWRIAARWAVIYDRRANRIWDPGQAICAEAYGPDWMHSPVWRAADERPETEPPDPALLAAGRRLAFGDPPDWMGGSDE